MTQATKKNPYHDVHLYCECERHGEYRRSGVGQRKSTNEVIVLQWIFSKKPSERSTTTDEIYNFVYLYENGWCGGGEWMMDGCGESIKDMEGIILDLSWADQKETDALCEAYTAHVMGWS